MAAERLTRFVLYGVLGWCAEVLWTASLRFAETGDLRLVGTTYLWMFPIYGSAAFLFEPLHDAIRRWPLPARALAWALGISAVEWLAGWSIERLTGRCPWDYVAAGARFAANAYVRWDYLPVWAAFGLVLERFHDLALRLAPAFRAARR